jgi:hypothetical protein
MKLSAPAWTNRSGVILAPARRKSGWLRAAFLHASCLSQSAVAAGAYGVDFLDPSAVRAANRQVLLSAVEDAAKDGDSTNPGGGLAVPQAPAV